MPEPTTSPYFFQINEIQVALKQLPPTELSYYLSLLAGSIGLETYSEKNANLLLDIKKLIDKLKDFYTLSTSQDTTLTAEQQAALTKSSQELMAELEHLIKCSGMESASHQAKRALFGICSTVLIILSSFVTALVGGVAGFCKPGRNNNFRAATLGSAMGFLVGLHVNLRAPHKAFQSEFEDRLEFCIDSIKKVGKREVAEKRSYAQYAEETKAWIKSKFYADLSPAEQDAALEKLLTTPHKFQVCSANAGFISPHLRGYFGQHCFIRYHITHNDSAKAYTMEFNPGDEAPDRWEINQFETEREVSGPTFFNMLVMNRILSETHEFSIGFLLKTYSVGSNDCLTYVNKILLATGQAPSKLQRFNGEVEDWQSTKVTAPIMAKFSIMDTNGAELGAFGDGVERPVEPHKFVRLPKEERARIKADENAKVLAEESASEARSGASASMGG